MVKHNNEAPAALRSARADGTSNAGWFANTAKGTPEGALSAAPMPPTPWRPSGFETMPQHPDGRRYAELWEAEFGACEAFEAKHGAVPTAQNVYKAFCAANDVPAWLLEDRSVSDFEGFEVEEDGSILVRLAFDLPLDEKRSSFWGNYDLGEGDWVGASPSEDRFVNEYGDGHYRLPDDLDDEHLRAMIADLEALGIDQDDATLLDEIRSGRQPATAIYDGDDRPKDPNRTAEKLKRALGRQNPEAVRVRQAEAILAAFETGEEAPPAGGFRDRVPSEEYNKAVGSLPHLRTECAAFERDIAALEKWLDTNPPAPEGVITSTRHQITDLERQREKMLARIEQAESDAEQYRTQCLNWAQRAKQAQADLVEKVIPEAKAAYTQMLWEQHIPLGMSIPPRDENFTPYNPW